MSFVDPRERAADDVVRVLEDAGYQVEGWDMTGCSGSTMVEFSVKLRFDWTETPSNKAKDEGTQGS